MMTGCLEQLDKHKRRFRNITGKIAQIPDARRYFNADHSKIWNKDNKQTGSTLNMFIQQLLQPTSKKLESPLVSEPCQVMKMPLGWKLDSALLSEIYV